MLHYILCSMKRKKYRGMVTIGVSIFLVLLLNLYFGSIHSYQKQLKELSENIPVFCQITDKSGSQKNDIGISEEIVDSLLDTPHVKDLALTAWMAAGVGDFPMEEWRDHAIMFVAGLNRAEAIPGLTQEQIHMDAKEQMEFFDTTDKVCIVRDALMEKNRWKVGDVIPLNLIRYIYDDKNYEIQSEQLKVVDFKITGTMDEHFVTTAAIFPDMLMPFGAVRDVFVQEKVPFVADSASFYVKDPLDLDTFKEEMQSIGLMETASDSMSSYIGNALTVDDSMFISFANHLRQSIDILNAFFPVVCAAVIIIGYVVSFLLGSSRQEEFALLRALGQHKREVVCMFWLEQLFLAAAGNLAGSLIAILFTGDVSVALMVNAVIFISYLAGCAAAFLRIRRKNTMQLLFMQN